MPCDSIVINNIDFEAAKNHIDLLAESMRALGYTVTKVGNTLSFYGSGFSGTYSSGKFRVQEGFESRVDAIKQSFGKTVVRAAAKKFGWTVSEKNGKMQMRKRV